MALSVGLARSQPIRNGLGEGLFARCEATLGHVCVSVLQWPALLLGQLQHALGLRNVPLAEHEKRAPQLPDALGAETLQGEVRTADELFWRRDSVARRHAHTARARIPAETRAAAPRRGLHRRSSSEPHPFAEPRGAPILGIADVAPEDRIGGVPRAPPDLTQGETSLAGRRAIPPSHAVRAVLLSEQDRLLVGEAGRAGACSSILALRILLTASGPAVGVGRGPIS